MSRLLPRSLAGRMALLIGLALLVAQLINFALILNERQKLSLAQNEGPAISRFVGTVADAAQAAPEFRSAVLSDRSIRGGRFFMRRFPIVGQADRDPPIEARLADALADAGLKGWTVRAAAGAADARGWRRPGRTRRDLQVLRFAARPPGAIAWYEGRILAPRRDGWLAFRLGAATLVLYLLVLGASLLIARALTSPLAELARAADRFRGRGDAVEVTPRGPADLARALEAFNAMSRRIVALLDEKDRMLGAIGHDLRTPLASLRIRLEAIEDPDERARAASTVDEMVAMLEDILMLARTGRARDATRPTDVDALCAAVAEEFAETGAAVEHRGGARLVAAVQPMLIRRALRNLVDNAVKYGGGAAIGTRTEGADVVVEVTDNGPGVPADQIAHMTEPFRRLESSRSRETGGSGLGLAIVQAIAEGHGGTLELTNRPEGGLAARLRLPVEPALR